MQRTAHTGPQWHQRAGDFSLPADPTRITVLIAEDDPLVREALATIIGEAEGFEIVGTADDAESAISAGFASLRHILDLMPDLIKLDLTLVQGIDHDQPRRALATGLISFAHEIDAEIVAEGIETARELLSLRHLGVRLGQGYFLARPAPLPQIIEQTITIGQYRNQRSAEW